MKLTPKQRAALSTCVETAACLNRGGDPDTIQTAREAINAAGGHYWLIESGCGVWRLMTPGGAWFGEFPTLANAEMVLDFLEGRKL